MGYLHPAYRPPEEPGADLQDGDHVIRVRNETYLVLRRIRERSAYATYDMVIRDLLALLDGPRRRQ